MQTIIALNINITSQNDYLLSLALAALWPFMLDILILLTIRCHGMKELRHQILQSVRPWRCLELCLPQNGISAVTHAKKQKS